MYIVGGGQAVLVDVYDMCVFTALLGENVYTLSIDYII